MARRISKKSMTEKEINLRIIPELTYFEIGKVRISCQTGEIEFLEGYNPDEIAKLFWEFIANYKPKFIEQEKQKLLERIRNKKIGFYITPTEFNKRIRINRIIGGFQEKGEKPIAIRMEGRIGNSDLETLKESIRKELKVGKKITN